MHPCTLSLGHSAPFSPSLLVWVVRDFIWSPRLSLSPSQKGDNTVAMEMNKHPPPMEQMCEPGTE